MNRKAIFDAVRKMLGRGYTDPEVAALDAAIDEALGIAPSARAIGPEGIALIKQFEGCKLTAYPDPGTGGDPWTIGWGATGPGIRKGVVWIQKQADDRLLADLLKYAAEVAKAIDDAPTTQGQFDALVSFHYNTGAIGKATLTKAHKSGQFDTAAREFGKWINAGGRVMPGLVKRRAAEAALYRKGS